MPALHADVAAAARTLVLVALLAVAVPPTAAQAPEARLELAAPTVPPLRLDGPTTVPVSFVYASPTLATGQPHALQWSAACDHVRLVGGASGAVSAPAGATQVEGVHDLQVQPVDGAPGLEERPCTISATASGPDGLGMAAASVEAGLAAAYLGRIALEVAEAHKVGGPQEQLRYDVRLTSHANAVTIVRFADLQPRQGWRPVTPDDVALQPGETVVVVFAVGTPFENGPNRGASTFLLQATPAAAKDPTLVGEPVGQQVTARVQGWYVPGPLPLLALALAAVAGRRLRA